VNYFERDRKHWLWVWILYFLQTQSQNFKDKGCIFVPLFPSAILVILYALYRFVDILSYLSTSSSQECADQRQVPCRWPGAHVSRTYRLHTRQIAVSTDGRYRKPYCVASLFLFNKMAAGLVWELSPEPLEICVGVHVVIPIVTHVYCGPYQLA
jgi:hypothetical protein